jgi:hydroxypyruvate isomerase
MYDDTDRIRAAMDAFDVSALGLTLHQDALHSGIQAALEAADKVGGPHLSRVEKAERELKILQEKIQDARHSLELVLDYADGVGRTIAKIKPVALSPESPDDAITPEAVATVMASLNDSMKKALLDLCAAQINYEGRPIPAIMFAHPPTATALVNRGLITWTYSNGPDAGYWSTPLGDAVIKAVIEAMDKMRADEGGSNA